MNRVDEEERLLQQALALSLMSRASSSSVSSSPSSSSCTDADADQEIVQLEELCRKEFGFKLGKLNDRLRLQSEELQSSLHGFCAEVLRTPDPAQRRDLAKSFIMGIAGITQLATDRSIRTLVKMQSTFLENMQSENGLLRSELARCEDEAAELKAALQRSEAEKESIEAEAHNRFEEEKAILEVSLREELQACQICEINPRNVVIMPCLHGQYCADCLEGHQKTHKTCPTCRGVIRGTLPYIA